MSQWRIVVKALHSANKPITRAALELALHGRFDTYPSLRYAASLGLVSASCAGSANATWSLTPLGVAYCEGLAGEVYPPRTRGIQGRQLRIVATWMAPLPSGVRLQPKPIWADCSC